MKLSALCVLALCTITIDDSQAFLLPSSATITITSRPDTTSISSRRATDAAYSNSILNSRKRNSNSHTPPSSSLLVRYSAIAASEKNNNNPNQQQTNKNKNNGNKQKNSNKSSKDLQQFNMALDTLAEQAGNFHQPVISRASECERMWKAQLQLVVDADIATPSPTTKSKSSLLTPDTISFNTVLKAWNRCCNALSESSRHHKSLPEDRAHATDVYTPRDAAKRATALLFHQEELKDGDGPAAAKPDTASYNIVIDAWAKSRLEEAPEAAERLLKRMLDNDDESVEPDTLTYHSVLDAWANSGKEDSLHKVTQIFHHMENLQKEGKPVIPTIRTVNAILNAYAKRASRFVPQHDGKNNPTNKSAEYAAEAHELLEQMKRKYNESGDRDWQPDVTSYTVVMDVYARCGAYQATQTAENLLHEVKQQYAATQDVRLRPNFRTYTTLIAAWARTRSDEAPRRVEELLAEMAKSPATRPNSRAYTSAIQCWARSRDSAKARQALKVLREMKKEHAATNNEDIRPTILTYNAAIDACARTRGTPEQQTEAIKIAFAVLKASEGDSCALPNHGTFRNLMMGVGNLMPAGKDRNQVASAVFEKAKKAGLVEFGLIKNLRKSVDAQVMTLLMEGNVDKNGNFNPDALPPKWSRNVKLQ